MYHRKRKFATNRIEPTILFSKTYGLGDTWKGDRRLHYPTPFRKKGKVFAHTQVTNISLTDDPRRGLRPYSPRNWRHSVAGLENVLSETL